MGKFFNLALVLFSCFVISYEKHVTVCKSLDSASNTETCDGQIVYMQGSPGPKGDKGEPGYPGNIDLILLEQMVEQKVKQILGKNSTETNFAQRLLFRILQMKSNLPNIFPHWYTYHYDDGLPPVNLIKDGGEDMYDTPGNQVKIYKGWKESSYNYLSYNSLEMFSTYDIAVGGKIGTYPFAAITWIKTDENTPYTILVYSDYGADGGGKVSNSSGEIKNGLIEIQYQTFQVYGLTDASICEVYFIASCLGISSTNHVFEVIKFSDTSTVGINRVRIKGRPMRLYFGYILISQYVDSSTVTSKTTNDQIEEFFRQLNITKEMFV